MKEEVYHQEDKSISVNEEEAEVVRFIFDQYIQGYGAYTISRQLEKLGKKNKKGIVKWTDSGVLGIIKNEKYKGDLLLPVRLSKKKKNEVFMLLMSMLKEMLEKE